MSKELGELIRDVSQQIFRNVGYGDRPSPAAAILMMATIRRRKLAYLDGYELTSHPLYDAVKEPTALQWYVAESYDPHVPVSIKEICTNGAIVGYRISAYMGKHTGGDVAIGLSDTIELLRRVPEDVFKTLITPIPSGLYKTMTESMLSS